MPSDTEFPAGVVLAAGVFVSLLAFNVDQFAGLTGLGAFESAAVLVVAPLALAVGVAVAIRGRLGTRRQWLQFVAAGAVLGAILELAVVGVAVHGVDRWDLVWLGATIVLTYVMQRFDLPTGAR